MGKEVQHVDGGDLGRVLHNHREERLEIERHRPQHVRPRPARHELQITIHQPMAQQIPDLTGPRHSADKTREAAHRSTLPPPGRMHPYASDITHVLGDMSPPKARRAAVGLTLGGQHDLPATASQSVHLGTAMARRALHAPGPRPALRRRHGRAASCAELRRGTSNRALTPSWPRPARARRTVVRHRLIACGHTHLQHRQVSGATGVTWCAGGKSRPQKAAAH